MKNLKNPARIVATLAFSLLALFGLAAPAHADAQELYTSTPVNGMWHRGTTQYHQSDTKFTANITFNDRAGDTNCTLLRVRIYSSNGAADLWTFPALCGGKTWTANDTWVAPSGYYITWVEIWTVRADGALRSYMWEFNN